MVLHLTNIESFAQHQPSPVHIVQSNLEAYNRRDIISFRQSLHPQVALYEMGQTQPTVQGLEAVAARYEQLFQQSPQLHSTILKRITIGNKVIDHEEIIGRNGQMTPLYLVVIYEVNEGLIARLTIIRE